MTARWTLSKQFRFEAAHQLPSHDGKCARLHGHSWLLRVVVSGSRLTGEGPRVGMLVDYGDIKRAVQPLVDKLLDHHHLNDTTRLANPTSEALAEFLYWRLSGVLDKLKAQGEWPQDVDLYSVVINETCTSECEYVGVV